MRKLVLAAIAGTVVLLLASCGNKTTQDKVNHKVENAKESALIIFFINPVSFIALTS